MVQVKVKLKVKVVQCTAKAKWESVVASVLLSACFKGLGDTPYAGFVSL